MSIVTSHHCDVLIVLTVEEELAREGGDKISIDGWAVHELTVSGTSYLKRVCKNHGRGGQLSGIRKRGYVQDAQEILEEVLLVRSRNDGKETG